MSSFGAKRKARKIKVDDDEENLTGIEEPRAASSSASRKPFKKSSLRNTVGVDDEPGDADVTAPSANDELPDAPAISSEKENSGGADAHDGRLFAKKKKKKAAATRLSFRQDEGPSDDGADTEDSDFAAAKKATLGRRVVEANALKNTAPRHSIPIRPADDSDRPIYSKDYLNELRSSTPSTPKNLGSSNEEEEELDASELEGATIVDVAEKFEVQPSRHRDTRILTEAEIRERKDRRARLAHDPDFISLDDDEDDDRRVILSKNKQPDTRLVRDDEDFAEGFDEFVEDGGISLGRRAERAATQKHRAEMASLIHEAQRSLGGGGDDDDDDDDSDASEDERIAAYEAAQTRAGMDGLRKAQLNLHAAPPPLPKLPPLPSFADALALLQDQVDAARAQVAARQQRRADLLREKEEILRRQVEVQQLLKEAGERLAAARGETAGGEDINPTALWEAQTAAATDPFAGSRGLESFGSTPTAAVEMEDA